MQPPDPPSDQIAADQPSANPSDLPPHLRRWPGLFVREGARIVPAPAEDAAVARGYPTWPDKGREIDGRRLTLLTRATTARVGEPVRVIHVVEVTRPDRTAYVMGPKAVQGEYVDGQLRTDPPPPDTDPLTPLDYDGATRPGPAVDYNHDITSYTFDRPGPHTIVWRLGDLESNTLHLEITPMPA
jgi:hypothetical protein